MSTRTVRGRLSLARLSRVLLLGLLWTTVTTTVTTVARANGTLETFGASARAKGMANAQTGLGGGAEAAHYNPAALSRLERAELWLQYSLSLPGAKVDVEKTPNQPHLKPRLPSTFGGVVVGAGVPLTGIFEDRLYAGLVVYLPTWQLTHASPPDPATPFLYLYDTYTDHYEIEPAVSLRWFDWLSTGVGIRIGAGQQGALDLAVDPLQQRVVRQTMTAEQRSTFAPTAGVTVGPFEWGLSSFALGFSYRDKLVQQVAIQSHLEIVGLDTSVLLPVMAATNFSPRTFNIGAAYELALPRPDDDPLLAALAGRVQLALDLSYAVWSEAPSPFLDVRWSFQGDGVEDLGLGGRIDAPGPGQSRIAPVGFEDTLTMKLGAEYAFLDDRLAVRAGYAYRPTPVPDQTSGTNIIDATAHILATGLGARFDVPFLERPLAVDLSWQTQLFTPRTATKDSELDPVGNWRVSGNVSEVSAGIGYAF